MVLSRSRALKVDRPWLTGIWWSSTILSPGLHPAISQPWHCLVIWMLIPVSISVTWWRWSSNFHVSTHGGNHEAHKKPLKFLCSLTLGHTHMIWWMICSWTLMSESHWNTFFWIYQRQIMKTSWNPHIEAITSMNFKNLMVKWRKTTMSSLPSDAHDTQMWCSPFPLPTPCIQCIHGARGFSCAPRLKRNRPWWPWDPPRNWKSPPSSRWLLIFFPFEHWPFRQSRSPRDGWGFPWRYPNSWMVYDGHSKKKTWYGFSIPIIYQHIDDMVSRYLCIFTNLGWEYPDFAETSFLEKHTNVAGPSNGGNTTRFSQHETSNN